MLQAPYVRYVDDFALFHDDPAVLADWRNRIADFLAGAIMDRRRPRRHTVLQVLRGPGGSKQCMPARAPAVHIGRRLILHPRKTFVAPTSEPANFLGFVLHEGGKRALDDSNVRRFKGRLRGMIAAVRAGTLARGDAQMRIDAWAAHADHAHARGMKRAILGRAAKALRARPERPFARTA